MSALTSSIAAIWSCVSVYGNASSSSRCHGVSGANACPGADARAAYSCTSLAAICRTALRARPLVLAQSRAAQLVQGRHLAAHVPGQQVQRVGRHEQPVARLAPLARRVLDHQVLAGRPAGGPLHHVDVLADAVLGMHDVIARLERQRVDRVAPAGRQPGRRRLRVHPGRLPVRSASVSIASPDSRSTNPCSSRPQVTVTTSDRGGSARCVGDDHAQVRLGQPLPRPGRRARPGHHQHGGSPGRLPLPGVVDRGGQLAAVGRARRPPAASPSAARRPQRLTGSNGATRQIGSSASRTTSSTSSRDR